MALQRLHLPACAVSDVCFPVQGATALHIACQTCNADVVEALVEHGAPLSFGASSACKVKLPMPTFTSSSVVVMFDGEVH